MLKLNQLVPEKICLSCHGCCRYASSDTVWAPVLAYEEIAELVSENIVPSCVFSHANVRTGQAARIHPIAHHGSFFCPCFDVSENRCKIYPDRPFDCQLYPFLLAQKGGQAWLAVDKKCPFVKEKLTSIAVKEHAAYLKGFCESETFLRLVKKNPALVQSYDPDPDVEYLSVLPRIPF